MQGLMGEPPASPAFSDTSVESLLDREPDDVAEFGAGDITSEGSARKSLPWKKSYYGMTGKRLPFEAGLENVRPNGQTVSYSEVVVAKRRVSGRMAQVTDASMVIIQLQAFATVKRGIAADPLEMVSGVGGGGHASNIG